VVVVLLALVPLPGPQVARPPCHRDRSSVVRNIVSKVLNPQNRTKDKNASLQLLLAVLIKKYELSIFQESYIIFSMFLNMSFKIIWKLEIRFKI
jgi:hypothetical protein